VYQSYVYRVTNVFTKQFYIGSRTENVTKCRHPEDDLWKHYFTSSKKVKQMIAEYGLDSFTVEILSKHSSYEDCFWEEQRLIIESKNNPLRLNKAYVNPDTGKKVLTTYNETEEEKLARMKKMSETKKGKFNSNGHFGLKHSEETKQKMRDAQSNLCYTHSEETKQKMRGNVRSEEHAKKLSEARKGKPWTEARRLAQLNRKGKNYGSPI
jgi:hypothetical protein